MNLTIHFRHKKYIYSRSCRGRVRGGKNAKWCVGQPFWRMWMPVMPSKRWFTTNTSGCFPSVFNGLWFSHWPSLFFPLLRHTLVVLDNIAGRSQKASSS